MPITGTNESLTAAAVPPLPVLSLTATPSRPVPDITGNSGITHSASTRVDYSGFLVNGGILPIAGVALSHPGPGNTGSFTGNYVSTMVPGIIVSEDAPSATATYEGLIWVSTGKGSMFVATENELGQLVFVEY
jgi:hypothetical protein